MLRRWKLLSKIEEFCPWHNQLIQNPSQQQLWMMNPNIVSFDKIVTEHDSDNKPKSVIGFIGQSEIKLEFQKISNTKVVCKLYNNNTLEAQVSEEKLDKSFKCAMEYLSDSQFNLDFTITSPTEIVTSSTIMTYDINFGQHNYIGNLSYGQQDMPDFVNVFRNDIQSIQGQAIVSGLHNDLIGKIIPDIWDATNDMSIDNAGWESPACAFGTAISDTFTLLVTGLYGALNVFFVEYPVD